jgi:hypothetical protein
MHKYKGYGGKRQSTQAQTLVGCLQAYLHFILWRFDTMLGHGLHLRPFGITHIGYRTLRMTAMDA